MADYLTSQFDQIEHKTKIENQIKSLQQLEDQKQDFLALSQASLNNLNLDECDNSQTQFTSPLRSQLLTVHASTNITRPSPKSIEVVEQELYELQSQYLLAASQASQSHAAAECAANEIQMNDNMVKRSEIEQMKQNIEVCHELGEAGEVVGCIDVLDVFDCIGEKEQSVE